MPDMLPTHQTNDQTKQLQNDDIIRHNNGSLLDIMQLDNETIRNIILREKELKTSQTALQALAVAPGNPAGNYMFKVNNRNTRTKCERIELVNAGWEYDLGKIILLLCFLLIITSRKMYCLLFWMLKAGLNQNVLQIW